MEKGQNHILRLVGKIVGSTLFISPLVLLVGYLLHWSTATQYSNGFFTAGALLIVIGVFTVASGFSQRANFDILYAETAGQADIAERNQRTTAEVTQRYGTMIFLVGTGLLLVLIAVLIGRFYNLA